MRSSVSISGFKVKQEPSCNSDSLNVFSILCFFLKLKAIQIYEWFVAVSQLCDC